MKARSFKSLYSRFLASKPDELHFAAHSHHFWPDVSREAQLQAWDDAARLNDRKWEHIFSDVVPAVQAKLAQLLNLKAPQQIALAPNTHDLLIRVFSALQTNRPLRLLTSDSEFHSFARQLRRWEEEGTVQVTRLKTEGLLHDRASWLQHAQQEVHSGNYDAVFLSQVFFNSGLALSSSELAKLFATAPQHTTVIIDGYHGFAALPTDLAPLEGRVFYLAGGYKYAQAGEGVGFLVVPQGPWRPIITGWYAEFAQLSQIKPGAVPYSQDGMAFWGATQDPTGWYRFRAVWQQWQELGETIESLHAHILELQNAFLEGVSGASTVLDAHTRLFAEDLNPHGHFLTWRTPDEASATGLRLELQAKGVYIDQRGDRLRFGFGLYQDLSDVSKLVKKITR